MITEFEKIVNTNEIGKVNTKSIHEIISLAKNEKLKPSSEDERKVLFLGIDVQNDFMEGGSLGVGGSLKDVENMTKFIYRNMEKITDIAVSIDTHQPLQIFHPDWWRDVNGNQPEPLTIISSDDVKNRKWIPVILQEESQDYVEQLERAGRKQLCIWPYHCIEGTFGCALESQFANIAYFHSAARRTNVKRIIKGLSPATEMYGIFRPEYSREESLNFELLEEMAGYDQIIIGGEAKSHCVLESVRQLIEYFGEKGVPTDKIYLLEDCMSSIAGFEDTTETTFKEFQNDYGLHIVSSTELKL